MTQPNYVSLKQFKRITGISAKALIELLSENHLPLLLEDGNLKVDLKSVSSKELIAASIEAQNHELEPLRQLFVSRFAEVIYDSLDELLDAALESIPKATQEPTEEA